MRLAFIADGRAEHVRRWLRYFSERGDDILLLSTHRTQTRLSHVRLINLPRLSVTRDAFVKSSGPSSSSPVPRLLRVAIQLEVDRAIRPLWYRLNLVEVPLQALAARRALEEFRPDIVHAMRIQNEGYLAALAGYRPFILSAWGQDFVHFAVRSVIHRALTRWCVRLADAFTADCFRDVRLAHAAGLSSLSPSQVFPGNGGVDFRIYRPGLPAEERDRVIVYPRGLAPYLRPETLLEALALLLERGPIQALSVVMLAQEPLVPRLQRLVERYSLLRGVVTVTPFMAQGSLADLLQRASVLVSPSRTDGTPNSMLEAMACGTFPVMGDMESIREWITHGVNGLLFDVEKPPELAQNLETALSDVALRKQAQELNVELVRDRADYARVMRAVARFYLDVARLTESRATRQTSARCAGGP